jgi:hypothetical protein
VEARLDALCAHVATLSQSGANSYMLDAKHGGDMTFQPGVFYVSAPRAVISRKLPQLDLVGSTRVMWLRPAPLPRAAVHTSHRN